jgi:hypothetical protein
MRRAFQWLASALPFDPRSRRAIDETLADWAVEEQDARTISERVSVAIRGASSLFRTSVLAVLREAALIPGMGLLRRIVVLSVVPAVCLAAPWAFRLLAARSWPTAVFAGAVVAQQYIFLFLPWTLFAAAIVPPTPRRVPYAGLAMVSALLVTVVGFWGLPLGNQALRVEFWLASGGNPLTPPQPGISEMTVAELVSQAVRAPTSGYAQHFFMLAAQPLIAGGLVILASAFRSSSRRAQLALAFATPLGFALWYGSVIAFRSVTYGWNCMVLGTATLAIGLVIAKYQRDRTEMSWALDSSKHQSR